MLRNFFGRRGDGTTEMTTGTLDHRTAERLLRGALPPDDAPPGYGGVATLLQAARTEARTTSSERASETIAAMVAAVGARQPAPRQVRTTRRPRMVAAASAGLFVLFGSLTAAGALPSVAQDHVATVLAKVGVDVPNGHGGHGTSGPKKDKAGHTTGESSDSTADTNATTNHGDCVSQVAGDGGAAVKPVAQSDCGKPPTAVGPLAPANGSGPPGGAPPGQVKPNDTTPPTHPPQSKSGGSAGVGTDNGNTGNPPGQDRPPK